MKIKLFLPDFRSMVKSIAFNAESNPHPVYYYETPEIIFFYKPIGYIIYYVDLNKIDMPNNISPDELKSQLGAIEIPEELFIPKQFMGTVG